MDNYVYRYGDSNYINLTNKCTNKCTFCIRNEADGVSGVDLWLEREPDASEIISILSADKRDVVFCGFGEPTIRISEIIKISEYVKSYGGRVRLNTNGHGNAFNGYNIVPSMKGLVDTISVSLNQCTAEKYSEICKSIYGLDAFGYVIDFIKCCQKESIDTVLTVLDFLDQSDIDSCRKIAENYNATFRIRGMV